MELLPQENGMVPLPPEGVHAADADDEEEEERYVGVGLRPGHQNKWTVICKDQWVKP